MTYATPVACLCQNNVIFLLASANLWQTSIAWPATGQYPESGHLMEVQLWDYGLKILEE